MINRQLLYQMVTNCSILGSTHKKKRSSFNFHICYPFYSWGVVFVLFWFCTIKCNLILAPRPSVPTKLALELSTCLQLCAPPFDQVPVVALHYFQSTGSPARFLQHIWTEMWLKKRCVRLELTVSMEYTDCGRGYRNKDHKLSKLSLKWKCNGFCSLVSVMRQHSCQAVPPTQL